MPISITDLRAAANRAYRASVVKSASDALAQNMRTAFLCHSHKDKDLAQGLQILLSENGLELYIDWLDNYMPDKPNKETADRIKKKILSLEWFLFLATPNSTASKWCPWEIGYADSTKSSGNIIVIPTTDSSGTWYGNEYLQLYKQITVASDGRLALFQAGQTNHGIYIRDLR